MDFKIYLDKMKSIESTILKMLDDDVDLDSINDRSISSFFEDLTNEDKSDRLREILYLISQISAYHHRTPNFFTKIEKIFLLLKDDITKTFTNKEIYDIFYDSQNFLNFLIK